MTEFWAKYLGRESIVEVFDHMGNVWVRELWPMKEPREHATPFYGGGLELSSREIYWTNDKEREKDENKF